MRLPARRCDLILRQTGALLSGTARQHEVAVGRAQPMDQAQRMTELVRENSPAGSVRRLSSEGAEFGEDHRAQLPNPLVRAPLA